MASSMPRPVEAATSEQDDTVVQHTGLLCILDALLPASRAVKHDEGIVHARGRRTADSCSRRRKPVLQAFAPRR